MKKYLLAGLIVAISLFGFLGIGISAADQEGKFLYLKTGMIDPTSMNSVNNVTFSIAAKKLMDYESGLYIIQCKGPITEEHKQIITQYGVKLGDYIPDFAFIVKTTPITVHQLTKLDFVRAVVRYEPMMKISRHMVTADGSIRLKDNLTRIKIITFDDLGADSISNKIAAKNLGTFLRSKRFLRGVLNKERLNEFVEDEDVVSIEEAPQFVLFNDQAAPIINAPIAWNSSLNGSGQIIGICDTGLDTGRNDSSMHLDFQGQIQTIYALGRTGNANDTHGHGTHVAGSVVSKGSRSNGLIKGMAPGAKIIFQSVLDSNGGLGGIPYDLNSLFNQAYAAGARIHTNSWGVPYSDGGNVYNSESNQVDNFTWTHKDMLILFAAGNDGDYNGDGVTDYSTVTTPGTAKNCITVGASENNRSDKGSYADNINQIAVFSSRGWAVPDNRIKPDIVSPGTWILSTKSSLAPDSNYWGTYSQYYAYNGGTSMATPITAGSAALVRQFYTSKGITPSASLVKATLINGATNMGFGYPSRDQGWGRVNLDESTASSIQYDNESVALSTGGSKTYTFNITNAAKPAKFTLVWSDYPASTSAAKVLVNDLDLQVTAPNGTVYYGNDYTAPYNSVFDRLNNVENVFINNPAIGTYTVVVKAYNIPLGPQPFSLVLSGSNPNTSSIVIDNDAGAPGFTTTGTWTTSTSSGYNDGKYQYAGVGSASTSKWTANLASAGTYKVSVIYRSGTNRATSAKYTINTVSGTQTVYVNQTLNNLIWVTLGTWNFNTGSATVTLNATGSSGGTSSVVIADAVKFEKVAPPVVTVDNDTGAPSYTETGSWITSSSTGYNGGTYRYTSVGTAKTAVWKLNLPAAGIWKISVIYKAGTNRATSARYTVTTASGTQIVNVNQSSNDLAWVTLGTWSFNPGGGVITLDAGGSTPSGAVVIADAVKAEPQ